VRYLLHFEVLRSLLDLILSVYWHAEPSAFEGEGQHFVLLPRLGHHYDLETVVLLLVYLPLQSFDELNERDAGRAPAGSEIKSDDLVFA